MSVRTRAQREMPEWWEENLSALIIFFTCLLAFSFFVIPGLRTFAPAFFPDFAATVLGILLSTSLAIATLQGRDRMRRRKALQSIYFELKRNSTWLVGKGYVLNTDVWDLGKSADLMQLLEPEELHEMSEVYHQIELNIYEAKLCRQAAEKSRSLPYGPEQAAALTNLNNLSNLLITREPDLKKQIDDFLERDFWKKVGIKKEDK